MPVPIALLLPLLPGLMESVIALVKAIRASSGDLTDAQTKAALDRIEANLTKTAADVAALPIREV